MGAHLFQYAGWFRTLKSFMIKFIYSLKESQTNTYCSFSFMKKVVWTLPCLRHGIQSGVWLPCYKFLCICWLKGFRIVFFCKETAYFFLYPDRGLIPDTLTEHCHLTSIYWNRTSWHIIEKRNCQFFHVRLSIVINLVIMYYLIYLSIIKNEKLRT